MNNKQITKQILEKFKKKQIGWLQLDISFENYIDHQELSAVNDFAEKIEHLNTTGLYK